ncbi:MAG: GDSL-type esterase/lipase family protein, partial [Solirubrobacterales bacterium]
MPERFETIAEMEAEARPGREGEPHGDDSLMGRFDRWGLRRFSGWDAVKAIGLTTFLLLIFAGGSIRHAADELKPGLGRDIVKAVGGPAGWIADRLPFAETRRDLTSWLSPEQQLTGTGFEAGGASPGRAAPVTPPVPTTPQPLHRLLVTGDSLSTPLDIEIARKLADRGGGVQVTRDPHLATGISNTGLVDWGQLSSTQAAEDDPDAVVIFIGANEGYPMPGPGGRQVTCCGSDWEAIFRSRVEQMIDNYLEGGTQRIYWLTIPTQRDPARKPIADAVNRAIAESAASRGATVRVVDLVPIFTPGDSYRDSMEIDGKQTIVRESDGIHLNDTGSSLAADVVLQAVDSEFD